MSLQVERYKFVEAMVREGMSRQNAEVILRSATTIQRLAVEACNRELSAAEERRAHAAQQRVVMACSAASGFAPYFQGDPRGACVRIFTPSEQARLREVHARLGDGAGVDLAAHVTCAVAAPTRRRF